mgnify:CR=1 FL=1
MSILDVCKGPYYHKADHDDNNPLGNLISATSYSYHAEKQNQTAVNIGKLYTPGYFSAALSTFVNVNPNDTFTIQAATPEGFHVMYMYAVDSTDKLDFVSYEVVNNVTRIKFKFKSGVSLNEKASVFSFVMKEG